MGVCTDPIYDQEWGLSLDPIESLDEVDLSVEPPLASPDIAEGFALTTARSVTWFGMGQHLEEADDAVIPEMERSNEMRPDVLSGRDSPVSPIVGGGVSLKRKAGGRGSASDSDGASSRPAARDTKRQHVQAQVLAVKANVERNRGLTLPEKIVCLEELIANPGAERSDFLLRVLLRIPMASRQRIIGYRKVLISWGRVPPWLHQFLLANAATPEEEYPRLVAEAAAMAATKVDTLDCLRIGRTVSEWMQICIRPLLSPGSVEADIVVPEVIQGLDAMRLSRGQFKALLVRELDRLRTFFSDDIDVTTRAPTTEIPDAVPRGPRTGEPVGPVFTEMKRAVLLRMMDHSDDKSSKFVPIIHARFPGLTWRQVYMYHNNLCASDRVGAWLHDFLLNRSAVEWDSSMRTEIGNLYPAEVSLLRKGLSRTVKVWIAYCIRPLLAMRRKGEAPCKREIVNGRPHVRLSLTQRRALYAQTLADLGAKADD